MTKEQSNSPKHLGRLNSQENREKIGDVKFNVCLKSTSPPTMGVVYFTS
jgi:hypothetical protein